MERAAIVPNPKITRAIWRSNQPPPRGFAVHTECWVHVFICRSLLLHLLSDGDDITTVRADISDQGPPLVVADSAHVLGLLAAIGPH